MTRWAIWCSRNAWNDQRSHARNIMNETQSTENAGGRPGAPADADKAPKAKLTDTIVDLGLTWADMGLGFGKNALESTARALEATAKRLESYQGRLKAASTT